MELELNLTFEAGLFELCLILMFDFDLCSFGLCLREEVREAQEPMSFDSQIEDAILECVLFGYEQLVKERLFKPKNHVVLLFGVTTTKLEVKGAWRLVNSVSPSLRLCVPDGHTIRLVVVYYQHNALHYN
jgi:hypothetical protein